MAINDIFSFTIGIPAYRFSLNLDLYTTLRSLNLPLNKEIIVRETSTNKARNFITGIFLRNFAYTSRANEPSNDVLVMVDQDTVCTPEQIRQLVINCSPRTPIVSSNMSYRGTPNHANWFLKNDPDGSKKQSILKDKSKALDKIFVDRCGFGLIALHKTALIKMADKARMIVTHDHYSPDLFSSLIETVESNRGKECILLPETFSFCKRANELGIPIMVDLAIRPGHIEEFTRFMDEPLKQ